MDLLTPYFLLLAAAATFAGGDPVLECRAAHGDDPPAHIACLEAALRERMTTGAVSDSPAARKDELGEEQLRRAQRQRSPAETAVEVEIVSTTYDAQGLGVFRLANGQVWRETVASPSNQRLASDRTYRARIQRGKLGGYRMYVDGIRWMLTVRRIE